MSDFIYPLAIRGFRGIWNALGLKFVIKGEENIPPHDGAVLAMNHIVYLDFAIAGTAFLPKRRYVRFMAKKSISKIGDKLAKVSESFTVNMYDNGFMFEIGGRDKDDEWKNAKIMVQSVDELVALVKEAADMERE